MQKAIKQNRSRWRSAALCALLLLSWTGLLKAQEPQLSVKAPSSVPAGQTFEVVYTINVKGSKSFQAPSFEGLDLLYGPYQSQSRSFQFVNGRQSQSFSLSFTYGLQAQKEGTVNVGAASIIVDGKTYQSKPFTINVTQGYPDNPAQAGAASTPTASPRTQDNAEHADRQSRHSLPPEVSDQDLFITVHPDKKNPYIGEQVILNYRIYTSVPVEQFVVNKTPSNKGFWVEELEVDPQSQNQEVIDGRNYVYADIRRVALFAQNEGLHTVEPMEVEALAQVAVQRQRTNSIWDLFDDPFFATMQTVKKELKTPSLSINARPLPEEGRPLSFDGLVGDFDIDFDCDLQSIKTNEAATFRFTVSGQGNIEMIHAPQIMFPPDFEVYEPKISYSKSNNAEGVGGKAVFEYIVVPRHPGIYKIDAFSYSFFNPSTGKYEEKNIHEVVLNVEAGKNTAMAASGGLDTRTGSDIEYIKPRVDKWHPAGKNFLFSPAFWVCMGTELLLFGLGLFLFRQHARNKADIAGIKNRKAAKEAKRCLKKASTLLKENKKEDFFIEISQALWGFLSNKFNIPPASLSMDTVRDELHRRQVADELTARFIQTLEHCEFERFSPRTLKDDGMKRMYEEAYEIIYKITGAIR